MSALTTAYASSPSEKAFGYTRIKMAANAKIFAGGNVSINSSGFAVAASDTASTKVIGKAVISGDLVKDNTGGADGAISIDVKLSRTLLGYLYDNDVSNPLVQSSLWGNAMVVDDHTFGVSSVHSIVGGTFVGFLEDNSGNDVTSKVWIVFAN